MVTADVVQLDSVLVKVVQDSKTELISLPVVWLGNSTAANKNVPFYKDFNKIMHLKMVQLTNDSH